MWSNNKTRFRGSFTSSGMDGSAARFGQSARILARAHDGGNLVFFERPDTVRVVAVGRDGVLGLRDGDDGS